MPRAFSLLKILAINTVTMILAVFFICLTSLIFIVWRRMTFWWRQGVNGPSYFGMQCFNREVQDIIMEERDKYGRVYGGNILSIRFLVVNDPELIREIFVKNFHIFPSHKIFNLGPSPIVKKMLFFMPGDHNWKRIRSIVSPAFTSGKLKAMMSHISDISDKLVINLKKEKMKSDVVDIRKYMGAFAIDVLTACSFGMKIDSIDNPEHPLIHNAEKILGVDANLSQILSFMAPKLAKCLNLDFFDSKAINFFDKFTNQIVSERKKFNNYSTNEQGKNKTDFIQIMLDSEKNYKELEYESNSDLESDRNKNRVSDKQLATLSSDEMTALGLQLFIAAYDTSSSSLSHLVYYLAENKDCQQRLYEELKDLKDISYENLSRLKYLNAVIDETLRLAPPLLRIQRESDQDQVINGIKIPKGTTVDILPSVLHRDPEYWHDPLSFKPERFLEPTHHPYAYLPFGVGPRHCLGHRFALNFIRICTTKLLTNFEFSLTPSTKLEYCKGSVLLTPKEVMVYIKSRN